MLDQRIITLSGWLRDRAQGGEIYLDSDETAAVLQVLEGIREDAQTLMRCVVPDMARDDGHGRAVAVQSRRQGLRVVNGGRCDEEN